MPEVYILMTASAILFFHICFGAIGLYSGATSMFSSKGSNIHRNAGSIFFISMACMSIGGILIGYIRESYGGVLVALLALYSVTTAKLTLERGEGEIGRSEYGALAFILIAITIILALAIGLERGDIVIKDTYPEGTYFFAVVAILFAIGDTRLIIRRGISGAERIARHVWRNCFALFFSAISFFIGQPQIFPEWIHQTQILYVPELAIIFLTIYWLRRILSSKSNFHRSEFGQ